MMNNSHSSTGRNADEGGQETQSKSSDEVPLPSHGALHHLPDDLRQIGYQALLDLWLLRNNAEPSNNKVSTEHSEFEERDSEREKTLLDAEIALNKSVHDARLEVLKGGIERAQKGAEAVRNTAAAIGTIYTGIAGLSFVAKDRPLPVSGVIPALFLATALVLATAYVAWLGGPQKVTGPKPHTSLAVYQGRRLNAFSTYTSTILLRKASLLKYAVTSLGVAVALLPLPFLDLPPAVPWVLAGVGALVVWLMPGVPTTATEAATNTTPATARKTAAQSNTK